MDTILMLFKLDLGIRNTAKDPYYVKKIEACIDELERRIPTLDVENTEDAMLIADYAAWQYRNREQSNTLSENLKQRIRDRIIKKRSEGIVV